MYAYDLEKQMYVSVYGGEAVWGEMEIGFFWLIYDIYGWFFGQNVCYLWEVLLQV